MATLLVKKTDWLLRKALPEDKENIKSFFKKNLWQTKENAERLYEWKYEQNPAGKTLALIGVNSEDRIIATSMFIPWKLSYNNEIIKACQWVDLFVEPEYRGQPFPSQTLQQGLEEFRKSGAPVCFAFPNSNSIPIHKKNNGIHLGCTLRYTKPLNTQYLIKRKIKIWLLAKIIGFFTNIFLRLISWDTYTFTNGVAFEEIEICGSEFDAFWKRYSQTMADKVLSVKDSAYLNWKYINSPNKERKLFALKKKNQLGGFVVLESTPEIGYIVDIVAIEPKVMHQLIAFSVKYFRKQKKNSVVFVALENNMYFKEFKRFDFVKRPETKEFFVYLDGNSLQNKAFFTASSNWLLTIGECDIVNL